jgi:uncharacterized membrane protein YbhN (UPF0104 family)
VSRRRQAARLVSLAASGALLVALYRNLDVRLVGEVLLRADRLWLVLSIGLIVPITVLRAIRFFWVAPAGALPGVGEALRLTLVASALNMFVPAKGGDLVKSYFVRRRSDTPTGVAVAIVVYERLCDLFGLILCCLAGWLIGRPQVAGLPSSFWLVFGAIGATCGVMVSSQRAAGLWRLAAARALPDGRLRRLRELADGWPELLHRLGRRRFRVVLFSPLLWLAHLCQIWLFTVALSAPVPFAICASLAAIALMAGQVPFTVAGLGTRDVALVVLLSRYIGPESAAALGILTATRNLLPPLLGLPMMWPYFASVAEDVRRSRTDVEPG